MTFPFYNIIFHDLEIDFIAEKDGDRIYYQASDENTYTRAITPLKKINDHYPKFIISMDEVPMSDDGIKQINTIISHTACPLNISFQVETRPKRKHPHIFPFPYTRDNYMQGHQYRIGPSALIR